MKVSELRESLEMTRRGFANEIGATEHSVYCWERDGKEIDHKGVHQNFRANMAKLARKAEK